MEFTLGMSKIIYFSLQGLIKKLVCLLVCYPRFVHFPLLNWNEDIPKDLKRECGGQRFCIFFEEMEELKLPWRWLVQDSFDLLELVELHVFSNAMFQNQETCVYVRHVSQPGNFPFSLVAAKSRLASMKPTIIPRLQLLENLLLRRQLVSAGMPFLRF